MLWLLLACNDNLLIQKSAEQEGDNAGECFDDIDNDGDGYTDCADQDCLQDDACVEVNGDTADTADTTDTNDTEDTVDTADTTDTTPISDVDQDGFTTEDGDCDDNASYIYPGAPDSSVDGVDQNCDGFDGVDADGDGYADIQSGGDDCDDSDSSVHPNSTEIPDDGIDNDCVGGDQTTTIQSDFNTAGTYTFTVPTGVSLLTVEMWGAGGAGGDQSGAKGGGGGFVEASFAVNGGEVLDISVGEGGHSPGQGGGGTFIFVGNTLFIVAGAGGGGASDGNSGNSFIGGAGGAGGNVGENGMDLLQHVNGGFPWSYCTGASGGTGATQLTGGIGGVSTGTASYNGVSHVCLGTDGSQYQGGGTTGPASPCQTTGPYMWQASGGGGNGHGGAGGAGYYGGGGGASVYTYCGAGGGGGSSWAHPVALTVNYLNGSGQNQGNAGNSNGAGKGGDRDYAGQSYVGADGRVVLSW